MNVLATEVLDAWFLTELEKEPALSHNFCPPPAVGRSDFKSFGELETLVWTKNSNEQQQGLQSDFLN